MQIPYSHRCATHATIATRILLLAIMAAMLAGCHDDNLINRHSLYEESEEKDQYVGSTRHLTPGAQADNFPYKEFVLAILAPDGEIIRRAGFIDRKHNRSELQLLNGLKDGQYRLLYLEYDRKLNSTLDNLPERFNRAHFGLGMRIKITNGNVALLDSYNPTIGLCGEGTADAPYIISSDDQMLQLMMKVNSASTNRQITSQTYLQQVVPIDMDMASFSCDMRYGWYPIGCDVNLPFRGVFIGNEISNIWSDRPSSPGIGLFGFVHNATLKDIAVKDSEFLGNYAVGAVAGAVISAGDDHGKSIFVNCSIRDTQVEGSSGSFAIGGITGAIDMYGNALFTGCSAEGGAVTGSYNVGGIVGGGARRSTTMVANCRNLTPVTGEYGGTGGIIGACDTLNVTASENFAEIRGATKYEGASGTNGIGTGGIAGGAGMCALTSVLNHGNVSGKDGVGGLIGSTRIAGGDGKTYTYNNCVIRGGGNEGSVSGSDFVGGAMGEGQFGCYGFYNKGNVTGNDYVAGAVGSTSICSASNAVNSGIIRGRNYVAGIIAKTSMAIAATCHNFGQISATGHHSGGITGLCGNNTIIHYCGNFSEVGGSKQVGGIVGEIGDPRKWSGANIADCVVGGLEIAFAVLGPALSATSMAIHSTAHVAAIGLHILELSLESVLLLTDSALLSYGVYEILEAEADEIEASVSAEVSALRSDIDNEIHSIRNTLTNSYKASTYDHSSFNEYVGRVESVNKFIEQEDNDEVFFENLNLMREERAEELESKKHASEIIHEVVGGVAVAVSLVSAVAATVLSGGAAAPFIVAGAMGAVVGGMNAITKAVGDFQVNSAIVTQCANTGKILGSPENSGGIVGELQDACLVEYCLNAVDLPDNYQPFAANCHPHSSVVYSINAGITSLQLNNGYLSTKNSSTVALCSQLSLSDTQRNANYQGTKCYPMTKQMISQAESYDTEWTFVDANQVEYNYRFKIPVGRNSFFNLPAQSGTSFPTPNISRAASANLLR